MALSVYGRRRWVSVVVAVMAALLAVIGSPGVAHADPGDEAHKQELIEKLQAAARGFYDTRAIVASSQQRQAEITVKLEAAQAGLAVLVEEVGRVASARYKGSSVGLISGLITGRAEPQELLQGAAVADYLLWRDDTYLREYRRIKEDSERQTALLAAELEIQSKQLAALDGQKREAEKALATVGGLVSAGYGGPVVPAQPAPRNADGSLPGEGCSVDDPTTGGCLSPRMYHALTEARLAGFTRYVSCWRSGTWGEHPKGKACDMSAFTYNFGTGAAGGADRDYGNRLANWAVQNASALGVVYVIWYRQVWFAGSGWRSYSGYGDPSSEHTNHVHISMY
jgi:hypothetical protein